jgi:hypothetical protein
MHFSYRPAAALLLAAGSLLAACDVNFGGDNANIGPPPPCPRIVKVGDAATLTRFAGAGRDVKDVAFQAQIGDVASGCSYVSENNKTRIDMTMRVQTIASRGPALPGDNADFQYWVAVARIGGEAADVLNRDSFDVEIDLSGNATRAQSVDELEQNIFLRSGEAGDNYVIYVGLVLTEDEVRFNRGQTEVPSTPTP